MVRALAGKSDPNIKEERFNFTFLLQPRQEYSDEIYYAGNSHYLTRTCENVLFELESERGSKAPKATARELK